MDRASALSAADAPIRTSDRDYALTAARVPTDAQRPSRGPPSVGGRAYQRCPLSLCLSLVYVLSSCSHPPLQREP